MTLGKSVVALNGPWKFQIEDAPKRTRDSRVVMGWPGFDDFHWETVNLAPVPGQDDDGTGDSLWAKGGCPRTCGLFGLGLGVACA